jgi:hypothetical protein
LVEQELDQDIDFTCLGLDGLCGFLLVAAGWSRDWYVGREMIFEEVLPYNVWGVADYAEYSKLDDWCEIEGIGCL